MIDKILNLDIKTWKCNTEILISYPYYDLKNIKTHVGTNFCINVSNSIFRQTLLKIRNIVTHNEVIHIIHTFFQ